MAGNHRRHGNVVPIASIATSFVIAAFVLASGMGYVSLKNQLHHGADEIKTLEREIEQVAMRITVVKSETQKLSSLDALKRRFDSDKGRLGGLVDIQPDRIVWVDRPLPVASADAPDIQPASNAKR